MPIRGHLQRHNRGRCGAPPRVRKPAFVRKAHAPVRREKGTVMNMAEEKKHPVPIETERKFLIDMPDLSILQRQRGYRKSRIEQIYLSDMQGVTHRIRKRKTGRKTVYTETVKTRLSSMSAVEEEREITVAQYAELKKKRDKKKRIVYKTRHLFYIGTQSYEIDVYPQKNRSCILETEIPSEECEVTLPAFLHVIREVTGDRRYSNASLAGAFPSDWKEV